MILFMLLIFIVIKARNQPAQVPTIKIETTTTTISVETTLTGSTTKAGVTAVMASDIFMDEDINLIALITMAEAESESEYGKRLVIDTVLNRVDSKSFPNTIHDVVYQSGAFTPITNGRLNRCYVRDDIKKLVYEEIKDRTNYEVVFFQMYNYSPYGTPLFKVGSHYFSKEG